ncbi:unnamed protein product [Lupinus luteus]|uniref:Phosphoribulokinase/uridine kinase domain-containing protein n=1 Tax=Lupinus luteus TaxID=3873 RepID=A0AAV1XNA9_LUPLU
MEASYSAHFSGLRIDTLITSSPSSSSSSSSPSHHFWYVHDSFYRGLTPEELKHVHEYNFDHPDAFDTEQMLECVRKLISGQNVHVPIYDFKKHQRSSESFRQIIPNINTNTLQ